MTVVGLLDSGSFAGRQGVNRQFTGRIQAVRASVLPVYCLCTACKIRKAKHTSLTCVRVEPMRVKRLRALARRQVRRVSGCRSFLSAEDTPVHAQESDPDEEGHRNVAALERLSLCERQDVSRRQLRQGAATSCEANTVAGTDAEVIESSARQNETDGIADLAEFKFEDHEVDPLARQL